MQYSVTFTESHYANLVSHLFDGADSERAAYLICGVSKHRDRVRLLVREIIAVTDSETLGRSNSHLEIPSKSYVRALKRAAELGAAFVFVHSHPGGFAGFSSADDLTEAHLFRTAYIRAPQSPIHGSLVFAGRQRPFGRAWMEDGSTRPFERITVIGSRFYFFFESDESGDSAKASRPDRTLFDRQARAFGKELQPLLERLTVGVVGLGGTGSCVVEQLVRLGVPRLVVADGEAFDETNINRVYNSRLDDREVPKVRLVERLAKEVGLGTEIRPVPKPITFASAFRELLDCDLVFGCTDGEWDVLCSRACRYGTISLSSTWACKSMPTKTP